MRKFIYWYIDNVYTNSEIQDIITCINYNKDLSLKDSPALNVKKTANVEIVRWKDISEKLISFYERIKSINSIQIGYDIYDLTGLDGININTYSSENNGEYDWHIDGTADSDPTDIKLTGLLNISTEPYTGGEFQFFKDGIKTAPELDMPGNMIVFPAYTPHRVLPVTSGVRRTISIWIYGPKFR
jgi:PKHD-type hydroxylase